MDFVNIPLLAGALLVFLSVLAGLFSTRVGFSFLLVFLCAGLLAGEDGPGGWKFDDFRLSFWVGNLALAVILLDGGLRTSISTFRTGLKPAMLLASLGVVVCAGITALAGVLLLGLDWRTAGLLGAIVGSTDAAAVFALLTRTGITLNERVAATLEIESGINDPMAVYLTLAFIALASAVAAGSGAPLPDAASAENWMAQAQAAALIFAQQFGWGALAGLVGGALMAALLNRVASRDVSGGILALLVGAAGLSVFALTGLVGGSGFLAIYLFGLVVGNRAGKSVAPTLPAMDGYAWLSQAGMFLLLGLLVTPSRLWSDVPAGLAMAAVLILVARPLAVWLCLKPFRFTPREMAFIAWVGLRGAVPIVLALFPMMAGLPQAPLLFHVAFVVVLTSLVVQGSTIGWMARRLGLALPSTVDEPGTRSVFRDFSIRPEASFESICQFYGLPEAHAPELSVAAWMQQQLSRPAVISDEVAWGGARFVVRDMNEGRIVKVGLGFPAADDHQQG
jgi:cell volume regulation protein A